MTYDAGDLDAIVELLASPGYALVKARIEKEIANQTQQLVFQDLTESDTRTTRGRIRALTLALEIPKILRDEISAHLKENRHGDSENA